MSERRSRFFQPGHALCYLEIRQVLLVFLLSLWAPHFNGQTKEKLSPDQARILALEKAWNQAVQQKDRGALNMLLGPELLYIDYDGKVMDRDAYLASVESPSIHPARIFSESMSARLFNAAAVVSGVYREEGTRDGKPYLLRERFTDIWVRHNESWVCVASQSTLDNRNTDHSQTRTSR
jgi:ketosteroid isomerase-like protein